MAERTLTVYCDSGLCNRLRVLLSGLVVASATGRRFRMLWPVNADCGAGFAELFDNDWPVETVPPSAVEDLPYVRGFVDQLPDLLTADAIDVTLGYPTWLVPRARHPALSGEIATLACALRPVQQIEERVENFARAHFRPKMIGVHLRRGDMLRARPDVAGNTAAAIAAVDDCLAREPGAGIFLSTDDGAPGGRFEGVREVFARRYGDLLSCFPSANPDRRAPAAIADAVIDLWLLRATDAFIGTKASSFSEFAVIGRECPHVFVAAPLPIYRRWKRFVGWTGIGRLIVLASGRPMPVPVAARYVLFEGPRSWLVRTLRARWPWLHRRISSWRAARRG